MTETLPEAARTLIDSPEHATVATINPDGQPQLSVVWVRRSGDDILFSTLRGRRKTHNLLRDPRCTLLMFSGADPYTYLEVRGRAEVTDDPQAALIDELSAKYLGPGPFPGPRSGRVVVRLRPEKVTWRPA